MTDKIDEVQPGGEARPDWLGETKDWLRGMPDKGLFLGLLSMWVMLFHFLGNSTFGYKDTPSLFGWMNYTYSNSVDDEHGYLIPFVVAGLMIWKRRELATVPKRTWWPALVLVVAGLLLHGVGFVVQQARISIVGFFLGLYGLTGLVWGRTWLRATFFPFFLFIFCFPLGTLADAITFPLRMLATQITVVVARFGLAMEVIHNGTQIRDAAGGYEFEIAAACSGLRSLIAIIALSTIYAFMEFPKMWQRVLLIAMAFPLAVVGNVMRLLLIIIVAEAFGRDAGKGVHDSAILSLIPYVPAVAGMLGAGYLIHRLSAPGGVAVLRVKAA